MWIDPVAGMIESVVIASCVYGLMPGSGGILPDMNPDRELTESVSRAVEADGDRLSDLPMWRIGPGHPSTVLPVVMGRIVRRRIAGCTCAGSELGMLMRYTDSPGQSFVLADNADLVTHNGRGRGRRSSMGSRCRGRPGMMRRRNGWPPRRVMSDG